MESDTTIELGTIVEVGTTIELGTIVEIDTISINQKIKTSTISTSSFRPDHIRQLSAQKHTGLMGGGCQGMAGENRSIYSKVRFDTSKLSTPYPTLPPSVHTSLRGRDCLIGQLLNPTLSRLAALQQLFLVSSSKRYRPGLGQARRRGAESGGVGRGGEGWGGSLSIYFPPVASSLRECLRDQTAAFEGGSIAFSTLRTVCAAAPCRATAAAAAAAASLLSNEANNQNAKAGVVHIVV